MTEHAERLAALEARVTALERAGRPAKRARQDGDQVTLLVGGKAFVTARSTLRQAGEDSFLHRLVLEGGPIPVRTDDRGRILVDRSAKHFAKILDYLRSGGFAPPRRAAERDELRAEADFYGLCGLSRIVDYSRLLLGSGLHPAGVMKARAAGGPMEAVLTIPDPQKKFSLCVTVEGTEARSAGMVLALSSTDRLEAAVEAAEEWSRAARKGRAAESAESVRTSPLRPSDVLHCACVGLELLVRGRGIPPTLEAFWMKKEVGVLMQLSRDGSNLSLLLGDQSFQLQVPMEDGEECCIASARFACSAKAGATVQFRALGDEGVLRT